MRRARGPVAVLLFWLALSFTALGQTPAAPPATQITPGRPAGPPSQGAATGPRDNQQKPDTGTGRIAGRVIGGENGAPLRRAVVSLWGEGMREGHSTTTDEAGRFQFSDLPAGRFNLTAAKGGYVAMRYGQRRPFEGGKPLDLADGQSVTNLAFTLPRGGVITGRLTDEFGEPVSDMGVRVMRYRYVEGRRQLVPVSGPWTRTDDLGRYRAYGLPGGEYYVSASSESGGRSFGTQSDTRSGFAPTYYPGTPSVVEAQRVRVAVGTETTANFALLPARLLKVSGTAVDSEGKPLADGIVMVQEGPAGRAAMFTMSAGGMIRPDGTFSIGDLAAGEYVLHVDKGGGAMEPDSEMASVPITLASEDISGLTIVTRRGASITGQVLFEGGQPPSLKPSEFGFYAQPLEPISPMFGRVTVKDDWTFEATAQESPVIIGGGSQQGTWRIKSVLQRGVDVTDTGVVFRPGEQVDDVQIVMSTRASVVTGSVATERGVSSKEYVVVIYADDPNRWGPMSRHVGSARPDQQGSFEIKGLPPGNYVALAVEYLEEGQDRDPEFLHQMRPMATPFLLGDGERKVLNLKIVAER